MSRVIAVDGPAAAGKGTLARRLARSFGLPYLDTGLLYRAVGRSVLDLGADPRDAVLAERAARTLTRDALARTDLRGPAADMAASEVAAIPAVREALLEWQRGFAREAGGVLDGRDIGTVVFPDARAKLFVTATLAERARRRLAELHARGVAAVLEQVETELRLRDTQDAGRSVAPLAAAPDALVLDTTALDAEQAFQAARAMLVPLLEGR